MYYHVEKVETSDDLVVTTEELIAHHRINTGDAETAELERLLLAAEDQFEHDTDGRVLKETTFLQYMSCWHQPFILMKHPVREVTAITYYDSDDEAQELDLDDFVIEGGFITNKTSAMPYLSTYRQWPIVIEFTAGHEPEYLPKGITLALLMLASHWYDNPSATNETALREVPLGWKNLVSRWATGLGAL